MQISVQSLRLGCIPCVIFVATIVSAALANAQSLESTVPVEGIKSNVPRAFALTGATVVVRPGETLQNATIVVRAGVIESVQACPDDEVEQSGAEQSAASRNNADIPADARRIDLTGKTIYAGFLDGYSEMEVPDITAGPKHWNQQIQPQRHCVDALTPNKSANQKLRQQGITVRLVAPQDGLLKGVSALVTTGDEAAEHGVVKEAVAQHAALTPRGRSRRSGYPSSPMGAVALVRQTMLDMQWYQNAWKACLQDPSLTRPEKNEALQALIDQRKAGLPLIVDSSNERYFLRAHRLAEEFDLPVIVRGSGREYRRLAEIAATSLPVLLPVNFPRAPDVSSNESARTASLESLMHWDLAPENPARLAEAGVKFAITTDRLKDPAKFVSSIRTAVRRGLSEDVALAAITTIPAELFGVPDRLGSVEAGKAAHLVVTDGDLFQKKTKIVETWVDGVRFQHDRFDSPDVRGTWSLVLTAADGTQVAGTLTLTGKRSSPSGNLKVGEDQFEIKRASWSDYRLMISCDAQAMSADGVLRMTFVVTSKEIDGQEVYGKGTLPDGQTVRAVASWLGEAKDAEKTRSEKDRGTKKGPTADEDSKAVRGSETETTGSVDDAESDPGQRSESKRPDRKAGGDTTPAALVKTSDSDIYRDPGPG